MKPEPPNDDELQRILSLKRHEQPPRKFFQGFSDKIIDRLHKPEPPHRPTWWQRMGLDFDTKPVLVCASGVGVCGLLAYGLITSRHVEPPPLHDIAIQDSPLAPSALNGTMAQTAPNVPQIVRPEEVIRSVDPVMAPDASSPNQFTVRPKASGYNRGVDGK